MAEKNLKKKGPSTRDLYLLFFTFLIAAAGLGISIYLLVQKLGDEDKIDEGGVTVTPAALSGNSANLQTKDQIVSQTTTTNSPETASFPDDQDDSIVGCYEDRNLNRIECKNAGYVLFLFFVSILGVYLKQNLNFIKQTWL